MSTQRKWDITFALLIAVGLVVILVPDSALAFWGPDADEAGLEGAEYYCDQIGEEVTIAETSGSGEGGWMTYFECTDGSYGDFDWNCPSCQQQ